jgi:RNase P/RNase MRP subunit POP5
VGKNKMKLKQKPSGKVHRRYLLLKGVSAKKVREAILEFVGVLGYAEADPQFVSRLKTKDVVLAVERSALTKVRAALAASGCGEVVKVSGTLRGLGVR